MRALLVLLLLALSSPAFAWGPAVGMIGFGGSTCSTPATADELHEGWEAPGYENANWTQTVQGTGAIDNAYTLTAGAPAASCTKGLRVQIADNNTYARWDRGSALARTTNTDITVDFYVTTSTITANTANEIVSWSSTTTPIGFLGALTLYNNAGTPSWRCRGANNGAIVALGAGWHTAVIHLDTTAASSYCTMDGGAQQAFTRADVADGRYLFVGGVSAWGAGESADIQIGYIGVNTP